LTKTMAEFFDGGHVALHSGGAQQAHRLKGDRMGDVRIAVAVAVLIVIISTLTLQVHQVLFLPLSVFPKCKKYSISEV